MPKRKAKRKIRRRKLREDGSREEYGSFSLFGLVAGLAIIGAGVAYALGYFPESFDTASFNFELPKIELPGVPHSNDLHQTN
jgi:hypothetical protein